MKIVSRQQISAFLIHCLRRKFRVDHSHLAVKRYNKRLPNRRFSDQQTGGDMIIPQILVEQVSQFCKSLLNPN